MNKQLNSLVILYQQTKSDEIFTQIYRTISETWRNLNAVAESIRADLHEVTALYEDVLLRCIDKYDESTDFIHFYRSCLTRARADLYRKKKRLHEREVLECDIADEHDDYDFSGFFDRIQSDCNVEDTALKKQEADQRQLIDFLLSGADATTTAIAAAFLAHQRPTPTAIGKALGVHHSVVKRKLTRLASKFDSKKFGDYRDFLVAQ